MLRTEAGEYPFLFPHLLVPSPPDGTQGAAVRQPSARLRFPSFLVSRFSGWPSTRPAAIPPPSVSPLPRANCICTSSTTTDPPEFAKIVSTRARVPMATLDALRNLFQSIFSRYI